MLRSLLKITLTVALFLSLTTLCFALQTKNLYVTAYVPTLNQTLNVTVSKIDGITDEWLQSSPTLPIDFGTLTFDTTYYVFRAAYYYAVDVGVIDNTNNWTITHTRTDFKRAGDTDPNLYLNDNVNVSFVKQIDDTTDTPLQKVSWQASQSVAYTKSDLSGGWLRIYYGLGTGSGDAPGVVPIGVDQPVGTYSGQVTLTLTP